MRMVVGEVLLSSEAFVMPRGLSRSEGSIKVEISSSKAASSISPPPSILIYPLYTLSFPNELAILFILITC